MGYNQIMKCCNEYNEYNCEKLIGKLEKMSQSPCPHEAVIPVLTVETADGIKNVAGCFVHVMQNNTTYYIDDKSRIITVWAGPVEYDDYDYENNPFGLRSQQVWDFKNNRVIYYNKIGEYRLVALTEG